MESKCCERAETNLIFKWIPNTKLEIPNSKWYQYPFKFWDTQLSLKEVGKYPIATNPYLGLCGSMTVNLGQLKWESLKKRRKDNRLILLYIGLKGKARIPTDNLIPKTRRGRNQHSLAFQIPSASKDVYKYRFFPQTIRDWNDLPASLISSSELSDDSIYLISPLL